MKKWIILIALSGLLISALSIPRLSAVDPKRGRVHMVNIFSSPFIGLTISFFPPDIHHVSSGSTPLSMTFYETASLTLTPPATAYGKKFLKWNINGVVNTTRVITIPVYSAINATAIYEGELPVIATNRGQLNFGAIANGGSSPDQYFQISNSGGGRLSWSVAGSSSWITVSPASGQGSGQIQVGVNPTGLTTGSHSGALTITDSGAANSPQIVNVNLTVKKSGASGKPFGAFETPTGASTVCSSTAVTGWALDDTGIESVKIYRQEGNSSIYIGAALFVEGARPDVEQAFPTYPNNYKAGWGYMMLTNFLPNGGNGSYVISAIATDYEGKQEKLGEKTITVDNVHAVKPFGAIDTPKPGDAVSGTKYINWGWALTPPPNVIPTNGSTLYVWIDGVPIGKPVYNQYRQDIAALFPNYANSNGASGYYSLNAANIENGLHTIQWTATDNKGNTDGIGSRFFNISNSGGSRTAMREEINREDYSPLDLSGLKAGANEPAWFYRGYCLPGKEKWELCAHNENGEIDIRLRELGRLAIKLGRDTKTIHGRSALGDALRPLPTGSSLDKKNGTFYWNPGLGFLGRHSLVFIITASSGGMYKKAINVEIIPGDERED